MDLKECLEAARAVLAKAAKVREAFARAEAEVPTAAARAESAERAFARAHADSLIDASAVKPADLETLERKSERAERESRVAAQAARDLHTRLRSTHGELGRARQHLDTAWRSMLEAAFRALLAEARTAMAPIRVRLEELQKAAPPLFGNAASWALVAATENLFQGARGAEPEAPSKADLAAALEVQPVLSQLSKLEDEIGHILRERAEQIKQTAPRANGLQRVSA